MIESLIGHGVSSLGNVREVNEDSYHVDPEAGVFIVADGMGGHAAGEVASSLAVRRVREAWAAPTMRRRVRDYADAADAEARKQLLDAVRAAVSNAHLSIVDLAKRDADKQGMGTTFTGFLVAGGDAVFAHAGDSRAYLVRDRIAIRLTEDHTVTARLEAAGLQGRPSAHDPAKWQGILTSALGIGEQARVSTFIVPLYTGDRLLLCSDGVHDYVSEEEVAQVMTESPSPARSAQRYVDLALQRGGADNATAVVVKIVEAGETRVPLEQQQRDDAVLEASPLFAEMTAQQRLRALRIATPQQFGEGRSIPPVALGDRAAYLVLDGAVRRPDDSLARAGDLVYAEALLEAPVSVDAARAETSVRLLVFRRNDFRELCDEDEELGIRLFDAVAAILGRPS